MKKIVVALLTSLALSQGAFAADAAPAPVAANVAAVHELLDAMNFRRTWQASMDQMGKSLPVLIRQQIESSVSVKKLTEAERKDRLAKMEAEMPKVVAVLVGVLQDPGMMADMENEMVSLYSRHFTAEELKQMAAYYRTPVGQKNMQMMPQVMAESMAISQRITTPRLQKAMEQFKDK
ncbi:DUF2059 domain-containing protein [Pseudoduganella sp. OTU4001]|uniref:DUF2059 domain-containing protein n=1 Tax=Pseudoduganella sp. OTU4001 TaxID=3043854 RepID=UPI00313D355E